MFVAESNIWLLKGLHPKNNELLFEQLLNIVNKQLSIHKRYIWDNFTKFEHKSLDQLVHCGVAGTSAANAPETDHKQVLRQDGIANGILSTSTQFDII